MLIAMAGLPGSGKSTIAGLLSERLGVPVVSVDPIESAILQAGIDAGQPTGLAAYLVAGTLASSVIRSGQSIIVDAVNAVTPAREQWVNLAGELGEQVIFIEVVCSDLDLHRSRLESRGATLPHLSCPTWHAVEQSQDEYSEWEGPSADVARVTLDSVKPLDVTVEEALGFINAS